MHRIFRVKAYEAEHGPHFNLDGSTTYEGNAPLGYEECYG